jgi:hypothetical protein
MFRNAKKRSGTEINGNKRISTGNNGKKRNLQTQQTLNQKSKLKHKQQNLTKIPSTTEFHRSYQPYQTKKAK